MIWPVYVALQKALKYHSGEFSAEMPLWLICKCLNQIHALVKLASGTRNLWTWHQWHIPILHNGRMLDEISSIQKTVCPCKSMIDTC